MVMIDPAMHFDAVRAMAGRELYLSVLERHVRNGIAKLREEVEPPFDEAFEAYIETTVGFAPDDFKGDVRAMVERVIAHSTN